LGSAELLRGKKILVTGGSRGIGASSVKVLTEAGAYVGFTYHRSEKKTLELLKVIPGDVLAFNADTSDPSAMKNVVEVFTSSGEIEGIHGLVVNAGVYERRPFSELDLEGWRDTLRTNLDGSFIVIKEAIPYMKIGSIVLISSQLAFKGSNSGADYSSSKAGMMGLGRSLARELAPDIRVNMISPGYVDTDILAGDSEEKRKERIAQVPLERIGAPEEIAKVILFLLSDLSSYITGSNIDVNGGLYIH
jgi:3-oxoacyl-[acyl-carrier protein] reductase